MHKSARNVLEVVVFSLTEWSASPAKSRELNKECNFGYYRLYDEHDVWHFLSAIGLYFAGLFLLTMDDGLVTRRRIMIHQF